MQDASPEETEEEEQQGGGLNVELLRSYARFGLNGLKQRRLLIGILFTCGLMLTFVANKYLPRTYNCTTVLMTVEYTLQALAKAKGIAYSRPGDSKMT